MSENTVKHPPKEVDIQLSLYSLLVDTEGDEKLHGLKIGSGNKVYDVHIGRLSKKVSIKADGETLKLYSYKGDNLVINGEEKPSPTIDCTLIDIINDSLGGNIKMISEPSIGYTGPEDDKIAIIFVDCRSVLGDYRLFPFMRQSEDGETWSSTYKQIFGKTYSGEAFHLAGEAACKAYLKICEEPSFNETLKPGVIYTAFLVGRELRVPISLLTYESSNSMLDSVPMLFGAKWSNSLEGAKLKTMAPNGAWDEYIEDIGKKYITISRDEVLDWASFGRAWKNSIFSMQGRRKI